MSLLSSKAGLLHASEVQRPSSRAHNISVPNMSGLAAARRAACTRLGSFIGGSISGVNSVHGQTNRATRLTASAQASTSTAWTGVGAPRVVVLGGGFGGLYAAVRLDQLLWPRGSKPQVTLIDRSDKFVFKPLLYEVLSNTATELEVAPSFSQVLAPYRIRFVQSEVKRVEPQAGGVSVERAGQVVLADGSAVDYDFLIVALGAETDTRGVPGVRDHAVPFNTYDDAIRVKSALDDIAERGAGGSIMVVGAGYSGVELAATLAELVRGKGVTVQLVTPGGDVLEGCPAGQQEAARQALAGLGVQVVTGKRVQQIKSGALDSTAEMGLPSSCSVYLEAADGRDYGNGSGTRVESDLVVWTAGSAPVTKAARQGFPFPATEKGAIRTEPTLRVAGDARVFALGDVSTGVATSSSSTLPATAQVAFQQADYVAWNVWASINGRELLPFRYQHLGSMMSLGSLNGAVALPVSLPSPLVAGLQASPVGTLLSTAGVKLGSPDAAAAGSSSGSSMNAGSGVTIEGPLAAALRRAAYLYRQPTNEQRIGVATSWLQQAASAAAQVLSRGGSSGKGGHGEGSS